MIYILFILGIIIALIGWGIHQKEKSAKKEVFHGIVQQEQRDNGQYLNLRADHQDLKEQLGSLENKLDQIIKQVDYIHRGEITERMSQNPQEVAENHQEQGGYSLSPLYSELAKKIEEMKGQNKTIEEIASSLDVGKGEIQFLMNLLKK